MVAVNYYAKSARELGSAIGLPWFVDAKVPAHKPVLFWTHPFYNVTEQLRSTSGNLSEDLEIIKTTNLAANEKFESFNIAQLYAEADEFERAMVRTDDTHLCFCIGVSTRHLRNIGDILKGGDMTSRGLVLLADQMKKFGSHKSVSYLLTTEGNGLHLGFQSYIMPEERAQNIIALQYDSLVNRNSSTNHCTGTYAEHCSDGTKKELCKAGVVSSFVRGGSVFKKPTFNDVLGKVSSQERELMSAGNWQEAFHEKMFDILVAGKLDDDDLS